MAAITLDGISKHYGEAKIVDQLSLVIEDGELVVLVGPSGCGKSTILRMVAGLLEPTAGRIKIGDRDVTDLAPGERDIAMVFQSYALYPHMTVAANIGFPLKVRRLPKPEIDERVRGVATTLGLVELLDRLPRDLSGGQRQRVAMGRAIVREPKAFLFDEPLSNLDAALRARMRSEIATLHRRLGATMIYVTHDQHEAMTLGDRLVLLNQGRIEQQGAPLSVYHQPGSRFVGEFIGNPPMNFLSATLVDGAVMVSDYRVPAPVAHLPSRLWLGVRPEHLRVVRDADQPALAGRVDWLERTGSDGFLYVDLPDELDNQRLVVRIGAGEQTDLAPGDTIRLACDEVRLFDRDSGRAVETGTGA